jgi:hypothetical protein
MVREWVTCGADSRILLVIQRVVSLFMLSVLVAPVAACVAATADLRQYIQNACQNVCGRWQRKKENVTKCVRQVAEKEMDLLLSSDRRKNKSQTSLYVVALYSAYTI